MGKNRQGQPVNRMTGGMCLLHQKKGTLLKSWLIQLCIIAFHILCFGGIFGFTSPCKNSPLCGKRGSLKSVFVHL